MKGSEQSYKTEQSYELGGYTPPPPLQKKKKKMIINNFTLSNKFWMHKKVSRRHFFFFYAPKTCFYWQLIEKFMNRSSKSESSVPQIYLKKNENFEREKIKFSLCLVI